jgi:hypothetical protein
MFRTIKLAALVATLAATVAAAQVAPVPIPTLRGPVPVTAQSGEPFRGENEQPVAGPGLPLPILVPFGYIEEEYFVSGNVDGTPYLTSLLVRKPKDPAKFSGLVALETVHAQGAIPLWGSHEVWLGGGHAWVGVASQLVALQDHVKKSNPTRYSTLQLPDASMASPQATSNATAEAAAAQDLISQAILSQVGALIKSNPANGVFAGETVKYLIMGGASQTGGTTLRYIAQSHATARMPNGKPIYDGYLPMEALPSKPLPVVDAVIVHPVTEGDLMSAIEMKRQVAFRDDSDAPNDRYRHYQITGASHVGTRGISDPKVIFSTLANGVHPGEHLSQFPQADVMRPITHNFVEWLMRGIVPPTAARIEMANGDIVRDQYGNAKGGLRSPYVDVPTAHYIASASTTDGNPARRLIGLQEPLPVETLHKLYKTRAAYLKRFDQGIDAMVVGHFLLREDALRLKADEWNNPPF